MIDWMLQHYDELLAIYGGLVAISVAIVKLTPTKKDDAWLGKLTTLAEIFLSHTKK